LGANSEEQQKFYDTFKINDEQNEICENLNYLGRKGVFTLASGFTVAYLSGTEGEKPGQFNKKDVVAVRNSCLKNFTNMDDYRGIDFLLTSQWPTGMVEGEENTSKLISFLSLGVKPRYHFVGMNNKYFEKAPFRFPAQNIRSIEAVSRFISLAKQNNTTKSKFLYALNVAPLSTMRLTDLMQKSTDEIDCPYIAIDFSEISGNTSEGSTQFFWNVDGGSDGKRGRNSENQRKKFKPMTDQEKCWFCLSSGDVEKHLIISIGDNFYIALAKGPLNNYHALILPVNHVQSSANLSEEHFQELELFKRALKKFYESKNMCAVFFERNYKTSHMQVNAVGIDKEVEWNIKETFNEKAEEFSLQFETIPKLSSAKDLPERSPYFVVELPTNETLITRTMNRFPINFGRDFLCAETLLNAEDKVDWRNCQLSKGIEDDLVKIFRVGYKEFDFVQDDDDE
jgi:Protein similar to CwfJ C-terminus 1/Protein similar to CwfJ C-terminus 2